MVSIGASSTPGQQQALRRMLILLVGAVVIMMVLVLWMWRMLVLGSETFYQPRDAFAKYSDRYAAVAADYGVCLDQAGGCPDDETQALLEQRDAAIEADWPIIHAALMDLDNWIVAPHAMEPDKTTVTQSYRAFPDWEIAVRFFGAVEAAGGIELTEGCLPMLEWRATGRYYTNEFKGFRCDDDEFLMRSY